MTPRRLLLRVMVEAAGEAEARRERDRLVTALAAYGTVIGTKVEAYWKIPAYWEVGVHLDPFADATATFRRVLALAPDGWHVGETAQEDEDRWAVWNVAPGSAFLVERARWASVETWQPPPEEAVADE